MNAELEERVRAVVMHHLEDLAPDMTGLIRDESRIIKDIKLTGDDASVFAMLSAKDLKARVPLKEWRSVYTVGDAIQLLGRYAATE